MPPKSAEFKPGDLVWAHVRGYPRWPGQVADTAHARDRHLSLQKPGTLLIYFFGDQSFGWFGTDTLEPFGPNFDKYSRGKETKTKARIQNFKQAVEEGKEVLDRREGRTPATDHGAWDLLDADDERNQPGYDPEAAAATAAAAASSVVSPEECTREQALSVDPRVALLWLREAATQPLAWCKEHAEAMRTAPATCLLYSLIQEHVSQSGLSTKHLEKFRKRRRDGALAKKREQAAEQVPGATLHPDDHPDNQQGGTPAKRQRVAQAVQPTASSDDNEAVTAASELAAVHQSRQADKKQQLVEEKRARKAEEKAALKAEQKAERKAERQALRAAKAAAAAAAAWQDEVDAMQERGEENMFAELEVDLAAVQAGILGIARSPLDFLDGKLGTNAAAALRFREAVWNKSSYRQDGRVGNILLRVLGAGKSAHGVTVNFKQNKVPTSLRVPQLEAVSTKPGDTYMFMKYRELVPSGDDADVSQVFLEALAEHFRQHNARLNPPGRRRKDGSRLDLLQLFRMVAYRGGYQAVTATKGWGPISRELDPDVPQRPKQVQSYYQRYLLHYENTLCLDHSVEGDEHTIEPPSTQKRPKAASGKPGRPHGQQQAEQPASSRSRSQAVESESDSDDDSKGIDDVAADSSSSSESEADDDVTAALAATAAAAAKREQLGKREPRQPKAVAAKAKFQDTAYHEKVAKQRAAMLSDFDSLDTKPVTALAAAVAAAGRPPPAAVKREPVAKAKRPEHDDGRNTIVLRFPAGYQLPSKPQLLLAGMNSGPLDGSNVTLISSRYMALLEYSSVQDARKAEQWFRDNAHTKFRVASGKKVSVSREVKKPLSKRGPARPHNPPPGRANTRPGSMPHPLAGANRPGSGAAATPAASASPRTGVPFQTGVPYQPTAPTAAPAAAPVPSMMEFAGDSSGYNAGGMGYPGALPGGISTAYGGGTGSTGVAYDPRRAQAEPSRPAAQLPLPVDPRRGGGAQLQPLSSGWPQQAPPQQHHMRPQQHPRVAPQPRRPRGYGGPRQYPDSRPHGMHPYERPPQRPFHAPPGQLHPAPQPGQPYRPRPQQPAAGGFSAGMAAPPLAAGMPQQPQQQQQQAPTTHGLAAAVDLAAILKNVQTVPSSSTSSPAARRPPPPAAAPAAAPPPPATVPAGSAPVPVGSAAPAVGTSEASGAMGGSLEIGSELQNLLSMLNGA